MKTIFDFPHICQRVRSLLYVTIILLSLFGCEKKTEMSAELLSELGVPASEINTRLNLSAPAGLNTQKVGDIISIIVKVTSEDQVAFAKDFGARMFVNSNQKWIEVQNFMGYQDTKTLLSRKDGEFGEADLSPVLPDPLKATTVRIFLVGNIFRDGKVTDQKTAGYIDINLTP
jgi:hypothetical protein